MRLLESIAVASALVSIADAAIVRKPLFIQNADLNPDGFTIRSWASILSRFEQFWQELIVRHWQMGSFQAR